MRKETELRKQTELWNLQIIVMPEVGKTPKVIRKWNKRQLMNVSQIVAWFFRGDIQKTPVINRGYYGANWEHWADPHVKV